MTSFVHFDCSVILCSIKIFLYNLSILNSLILIPIGNKAVQKPKSHSAPS